jgi:hypothetical protein
MTAATIRLTATSRVPTMCAAILIIGLCGTFTRLVSACLGRLRVVHFPLLYVQDLTLLKEIIGFDFSVVQLMIKRRCI